LGVDVADARLNAHKLHVFERLELPPGFRIELRELFQKRSMIAHMLLHGERDVELRSPLP
jgi:hypothetical protein